MNRSLTLSRVLSLVGGLALVAAFFMPWFSSQGLLLSGQFLHNFLATASPANLRQFLPNSSPTEVQLLRGLVDMFPACGVIVTVAVLAGGLTTRARTPANAVVALAGLVPLLGWAIGISRLPPASNPEVGLALIAAGSIAVLVGLACDICLPATRESRVDFEEPHPTSG